jgi:hypothetical protein
MIGEVEKAILELLRENLSDLMPPENIIIGEIDQKKAKSISLLITGFTVEELGIGGSGGVKKEEVVEKFDSDGKKKDFKLSQKPLRPLISVENPAGVIKTEPDDYTVNYAGGLISFRMPPEKGRGGVLVKYYIARVVGESRNLKFTLAYSLTVWADDQNERDKIALEVIKVLYRERANLAKRGVSEIKLIKGYSAEIAETKKVSIIEYQVETTVKIEMPVPPIEKIEIGKKER